MREFIAKAITVRGPVAPVELRRAVMHEHLHADIYDWGRGMLISEEKPITAERHDYLVREAVPYLKECTRYGCGAIVDPTMPPWRAWPTFYTEASEMAGIHIILATGFYREVEDGAYWVKKPSDRIWSFVTDSPLEALEEMCVREVVEGIHGTGVHAGVIKLGTSQAEMTAAEVKTFRAGARAQKRTGVHITTHCTHIGAETSQLRVIDSEGVDLNRVVIGHTAVHLMDPETRKVVMDWMRRGANFMPTNLAVTEENRGRQWQPLVDAIREVFDMGLGDHLVLGSDWAFLSESREFGPCTYMPDPPYVHTFTHTLPAFREMGLTAEMEEHMLATNPQRIIPVQ